MDDVLVIVGLIAIAILFASCTPRPRPRRPKPIRSVALPPPLPRDKGEEEPQTAEAGVRGGWERKLEEVEEEHANEIATMQDRLAKARGLVSKSGVDFAACDILRMIHHWPSLLATDDGQRPAPVGLLDEGRTPAKRQGAREGKWVGWSWDGVPYRMELSVNPNYSSDFDDDLDTGELRLWEKGELVMHLDVFKRVEVQYDQWTVFGVSALRAGPWMLRLNELAGRLRIADEPRREGQEHRA
jgi:hypothetical protein